MLIAELASCITGKVISASATPLPRKMPRVVIRAYAVLADLLQFKNIIITTSATTVRVLIDVLSAQYAPSFKGIILDPQAKELRSSYRILVNGSDVNSLEQLNTTIRDGDQIIFFPPVGGG